MSTERSKHGSKPVQQQFTIRWADWDRLAGCLSLGLVGWLNNLLRSLVKSQVSKKSWRFAMLLLTLVSISVGGQSAWGAAVQGGKGGMWLFGVCVGCGCIKGYRNCADQSRNNNNFESLSSLSIETCKSIRDACLFRGKSSPPLLPLEGQRFSYIESPNKTSRLIYAGTSGWIDVTYDENGAEKSEEHGEGQLPSDLEQMMDVVLTVNRIGKGVITSTPAGINCGTNCTGNYIHNTDVELTATASIGYSFTGWSGSCKGDVHDVQSFVKSSSIIRVNNSIRVKMDAAKSCTASFVPSGGTVGMITPGSTIRGTVWKDLNGDGIRQPMLGEVGFNSTTVFLRESSSSELQRVTDLDGNYIFRSVLERDGENSSFSHLSGELYVGTAKGWVQTYPINPQYYDMRLGGGQQVTGKDFGIAPAFDLGVTKVGTGDVKSTDGLINCGATCTGTYAINKVVTLQATAGSGFQFDKWTGTGECNNNSANPINVQMIAAKTCTANFKIACSLELSVTPANWVVSRAGGTLAAVINVGNCPTFAAVKWTASSNVSWLTVSPTYGAGNRTISITATRNTRFFPIARTGAITINAGVAGSPKTIIVRQQ